MDSLFFMLLLQLFIPSECTNFKVELLTVVFRHGDRAPDPGRESYPNDPHKNHDYSPLIHGELNNAGKHREYNLGMHLRTQYGDFLGDKYHPKNVFARSTEYRRAKMSLQLVLSGLYPPKGVQIWNRNINWQPISITYVPGDYDILLIPEECPQYVEELERVRKLPEIQKELETFKPLLRNLTILTGKQMNTTTDIYDLYNSLSAERSMGLKLPDWTADLFPGGPLLDGILFEYKISYYNEKLRRLNGGTILRHIMDNVKNIAKGIETPRIHLLSGHETNVAATLNTLGVFKSQVPQYSSAVIVELLSDNINYYINVRHYKGIPAIFEDLQVPGCGAPCPLGEFMELMQNLIPTDADLDCKKAGSLYRTLKPEY